MENHNFVKVVGKGTVEAQFASGNKLVLVNILHVPKIKKNFVSKNLLCEKSINTIIEPINITISKGRIFVGKRYSCDDMYKVSTNKINLDSAYIVKSSTLWHNCLAHLNFKSLKFMFKHSLIPYSYIYGAKYEVCIHMKMTENFS